MKETDEMKKIRAKSVSGLAKELSMTKSKSADLKRNLALEKLKKTSDIRKTKKYIARVQTVMQEKLEDELKGKDAK